MGRDILSSAAYEKVHSEATKKGSATHAGEQRRHEGKGLHELVDPRGYGVIRRSLSYYDALKKGFQLLRGVAILEETRLDTTGSMGNNVEIAMRVLPKTYDLLKKCSNSVLGRYDVQMITSIFGDVTDDYVLCRSQAEMDERIAEQMTLMVPESGGGDTTEDPHYGIFGGAYLTSADINQYGLKYYDFTITDAPTREKISPETLKRVFGDEVFDRLTENGFSNITPKNIPELKQVVHDLLERAHAFVLLVGDEYRSHWAAFYSNERVITLPRTELIPQVKAAIIGLTEGVLTLSTVEKFLMDEGGLSQEEAKMIKRSVANIPLGAQMLAENFDKIPLAGAIFKEKRDLWPMSDEELASLEVSTPETGKKKKPTNEKSSWL